MITMSVRDHSLGNRSMRIDVESPGFTIKSGFSPREQGLFHGYATGSELQLEEANGKEGSATGIRFESD